MASSIFLGGETLREAWCNVIKPGLAADVAGPYLWPRFTRAYSEAEALIAMPGKVAYRIHVTPKPPVWG